jgi:plastocyanin
MRRTGIFLALFVCVGLLVGATATIDVVAGGDRGGGNREVVMLDDCDPTDPGWAPTGGCNLPDGDVTAAEFGAFRLSPLAPSVIGHPAWWFDPNYLKIESGKRLKIRNEGGRVHTFTEVANFGGGRVPPLNGGQPGTAPLTVAPECVAPGVIDIAGGGRDVVDGLEPGIHRFQCCIHPWMRTMVRVDEKRGGGGDEDRH